MIKKVINFVILIISVCSLMSCNNATKATSKKISFNTVDLNGNTVTEDIFKNKDFTILNIWGTYCSPCINEMPELGTWNKELPDNVQLIGIVIDVDAESKYNKETADEIVNTTGADYTHLLYNESLSSLLENVMAIPTTMFIDKEGNVLGDAIVGAYVNQYRDRLETLLNE